MINKAFCVLTQVLLILIMLSLVLFGISRCEVFVDESPNGSYQIVSLWIDEGAFGYGGAFYLKEKGLFSKWHRLGQVPFSSEWLSETEFSIQYSYTVDEDYCKEYNVNDFFDK